MGWYTLKNISHSGRNTVATIEVPASSPWFSGHFPGMPVLPGIAQLDMVHEIIEHSTGLNLRLFRLSRVRFKKNIVPDHSFDIVITAPEQSSLSFSFRIIDRDGLILSGTMDLEK